MNETIVVALAIRDDVEEVISCSEFLAKPGMTVVVLLRYPLERWPYLRDHWIASESVRVAVEQGRRNLSRYSLASERELAERKFARVRQALGKLGVEVKIGFYTGSLKAKLEEYSADPQVSWIVRPARSRAPLSFVLDRVSAHFRSLQSTSLVSSWSLLRVACRRGTHEQTC
jgi:hypothetical protein